jgi:putative transposase
MPRVFAPDIPCHVIVRGNNKQDIVRSDSDRKRFLADLCETARLNGLRVHVYVLMTNHVHLLATGATPDALPKSIQGLGRRYVAYFNLRHSRTGTLWEGRYKSALVTGDRYFLACHRYIELNPVRAGIADSPAAFRWSSHRFYALGYADALVTPHSIWDTLGHSDSERRASFLDLFDEQLDAKTVTEIRISAQHGWALGDEDRCKELEAAVGVRITPIGKGWKKGRPRGAHLAGDAVVNGGV